MKVAFIGLGTMGAPMAGHLLKSDCALRVYNRGAARAQQWSERFGAPVSQTVAEAVAEADVVALCLGADEDVRAMVSEHLLAHLKAGAVIVDHSTTSAALARDMSALCEKQQVAFIDAPVSGGQAGAEAGKLTVMAGGRDEAFARIASVLDCYAAKYRLVGESGAGQLAKMVNQVCIAGLLQGLAEGIHLGQSAGLDMEAVLDTISGGAAQSWQMDNRASTMLKGQYDFGFAVDWMRKDLGYVLDEARRQGASLPVTALVDQFYAQVQQLGGGRNDTSSLLRALQSSLKDQQH